MKQPFTKKKTASDSWRDPLMDTASKCPNVINQGLHKHHRRSIMNRNTGMNAGQIIGTMNGQPVVGLNIAKKVFQLHTVDRGTGEIVNVPQKCQGTRNGF